MPIHPRVNDGRVRLPAAEVRRIRLVHLLSGLDEDGAPCGEHAIAATITGYTEWISEEAPGVTIGWDLELLVSCGRLTLRRLDAPRSNLLLEPEDQAERLLAEHVDSFDWQTEAMRHLLLHFGR